MKKSVLFIALFLVLSILPSVFADENSTTTNSACYDTDNRDYFVKGTTKWSIGDESANFQDDYCYDKNTLAESYCSVNSDKPYYIEQFYCKYGCFDGAWFK